MQYRPRVSRVLANDAGGRGSIVGRIKPLCNGNWYILAIKYISRVKLRKEYHPPLHLDVLGIYQPLRSDAKRSILKRSLTSLNSELSFSLTGCLRLKVDWSLPYYLLIAGERIRGFIPFQRVLVHCEMQSGSSRIWTRIAVSISYDDNHYNTGTY